MSYEIPWMNKKEQPESTADILPLCFFQLISIDEEDEVDNIDMNNNGIDNQSIDNQSQL